MDAITTNKITATATATTMITERRQKFRCCCCHNGKINKGMKNVTLLFLKLFLLITTTTTFCCSNDVLPFAAAAEAGEASITAAAADATEASSSSSSSSSCSGSNNSNSNSNSNNNHTKIRFDPFYHKRVYNVGVHATRGLQTAYENYYKIFGEYLTEIVGKQRFYPSNIVEFKVTPYLFDDIFHAIENDELDFLYSNPGVYSCVGTEVGATALVTGIKHIEVRGKAFDLDVYGGVIAVRKDNNEVNTIADLKDKIIGAGAIIDLMGGQMQIYEMERAGMSFFNDPKQVVFTKIQDDVVQGVLSGKFDVGFVRTNQIELTTDEHGRLINPELFKVIDPKIFVMENGDLFPFLHSTSISPEWPFAALKGVPMDVSYEVQKALLDFAAYAKAGYQMTRSCQVQDQQHQGGEFLPNSQQQQNYAYTQVTAVTNNTETDPMEQEFLTDEEWWCDERTPEEIIAQDAPCGTTKAFATLSWDASKNSNIAAFRTSRSYFSLRTIQQKGGFMVEDENGEWYCTRPSSLYDGITCPTGYFKRSEVEFLNGCNHVGLACDDNDTYDCFCKPCVRAYDVDVYELAVGEIDPHINEDYGEELPGCKKMSICGTVEQRQSITLRIFDNMFRENAKVKVLSHAGEMEENLSVKNIPGTFAYEFTLSDNMNRIHVIEILIDDEPISQSPIRVNVMKTNCDAIYGEKSDREANTWGECVCSSSTYEISGSCISSAYFFLIIFSGVTIVMAAFVFVYLGYKKQQNDSVWHINVEELYFKEPPEVIGQGAFGVVVLGQYRGTKVAVKRVIPPNNGSNNQGSTQSADSVHSGSNIDKDNGTTTTDSFKEKSTGKNDRNKKKSMTNVETEEAKAVKFRKPQNSTDDIEAPSHSGSKQDKSTTMSKEWEKLLRMGNNNNALKVLESATSSYHGSGSLPGTYSGSRGSTSVIDKYIPLWLKFDHHSRLKKEFIVEMRMLSRLRHPCITTVMGAVIAPTVDPMLVMEYMEYGSLYDLLRNETMTAGGEILLQIARDVVQGIQFLHASKPPILHGDLKAKNILVDSRFRAKVADFGFSHFKKTTDAKQKHSSVLQGTPYFMAPEYLLRRTEYNSACDIYSLSMILYEVYARADPFEGEDPRKTLPKICHPRINKRPPIPAACPPKMAEIMKKCWSANPFFRPSAKDLDYILVELSPMDAEPLEDDSGKGVFSLEKNKRKPASLYDVFPKHIADALNAGKKVEAQSHEIVTVVFSDIVGFTDIAQTISPIKVSEMLDRLYHAFDDIASKHNIFKVETIGDAYMGVTNLDGTEFDTHVKQVAEFAQEAIVAASKIRIDEDDPNGECVKIRVGFHSGPVVSNVIGSLNPRYGLFGDTVNTASRMESNSSAGKIHCTYASATLLEIQAPEIPLTLRGMIKVKGKGKMKTFWVGTPDTTTTLPSSPMPVGGTDDDYDDDEDDNNNTTTPMMFCSTFSGDVRKPILSDEEYKDSNEDDAGGTTFYNNQNGNGNERNTFASSSQTEDDETALSSSAGDSATGGGKQQNNNNNNNNTQHQAQIRSSSLPFGSKNGNDVQNVHHIQDNNNNNNNNNDSDIHRRVSMDGSFDGNGGNDNTNQNKRRRGDVRKKRETIW